MTDTGRELEKIYGNRVRVRVCGICLQDDRILLASHKHLGALGIFWAPPGGGLDFGESSAQTLVREFREETGLDIEVNEFLFAHEFIAPPLQAIELFFRITVKGGTLTKGIDPEMTAANQIIDELRFWSFQELSNENPLLLHRILRGVTSVEALFQKKGFFMANDSGY